MAQSYIRNWITQKLLLHKAIENLSAEKNDIQKQVEDYRTSLLIHKYKQKLIEQRLADEISEQEIEKYYSDNEKTFVLATPIVKAVFFILPKNAPNLKDVQKWYKSDKTEDQENLEDYCLTHARKYDHFKNEWIEVKYLLNLIPGDYDNLEELILTENRIEKEDEENNSLVAFKAGVEKTQKEELINSFSMLTDDDKKDVRDNIDNYSLEDIEAKLSIICVRNKVNFSLNDNSQTQTGLTVNLPGQSVNDETTPAWIRAIQAVAENN